MKVVCSGKQHKTKQSLICSISYIGNILNKPITDLIKKNKLVVLCQF